MIREEGTRVRPHLEEVNSTGENRGAAAFLLATGVRGAHSEGEKVDRLHGRIMRSETDGGLPKSGMRNCACNFLPSASSISCAPSNAQHFVSIFRLNAHEVDGNVTLQIIVRDRDGDENGRLVSNGARNGLSRERNVH